MDFTLEEREKELDILLYKVTHDIKGPLNSIIGLSNVAMNDVNDPKALEYISHIKKNTEKLQEFVTDLLNVTKINIRQLEPAKVNFKEIVDDVLNSLQFLEGYKAIKFDLRIEQKSDFMSDPMMIYSVFQNIIENAIKYSDESKDIPFLKIQINSTDLKTVIKFEDNGIGIEDNINEKVFEMFFRATNQSSGNGLGLYIVKKSIEKLGGSINMLSKLGEGTTTIITFPKQLEK
ncbi:MAG: HAMP domain-containing sensor histidine kinase [Cytophagales bacterium]|nr:HAMP domain-containing sensor histidine kinase [Cytophagales bacterium]